MTVESAFVGETRRRTNLAWAVSLSSVRYFSRNRTEMGWRDKLLLPIVAVILFSTALFAPDALSKESFSDMSQHAPVDSY